MAPELKDMSDEVLLDRLIRHGGALRNHGSLCINLDVETDRNWYVSIRNELLRRLGRARELQDLIDEIVSWKACVDRKPMNEPPWKLARKLYDTQERKKDAKVPA